jgi:sugar O-acyltransferase (sialic acid O-acetyltransferase NeuD family)
MKHVIVGSGKFGQVARAYIEEYSSIKIDAFAVSESLMHGVNDSPIDVISLEKLLELGASDSKVFVAIGYSKMNSIREAIYLKLKEADFNFISFVHPNVKIWDSSQIGENVFIFEDNTIQPFTKIGNNSVLWSGNHIGHHSRIDDHTFISSHVVVSGDCHIGRNSFLGVNATIFDGVSIGERCLIGGGAIINNNIEPDSVIVSRPGTKLPKTSSEVNF